MKILASRRIRYVWLALVAVLACQARADELEVISLQFRLAEDLLFAESSVIDRAVLALETEGRILRGRFTPDLTPSAEGAGMRGQLEWCDRRLLARIHRYTLNRVRAEIDVPQRGHHSVERWPR